MQPTEVRSRTAPVEFSPAFAFTRQVGIRHRQRGNRRHGRTPSLCPRRDPLSVSALVLHLLPGDVW